MHFNARIDRLRLQRRGRIEQAHSVVHRPLALGARAVLIGRPVFWDLAVEGETGVRMVLEMLRDELDATMGMCGCTTVASVDRGCLVGVSPLWAVLPQVAPFR